MEDDDRPRGHSILSAAKWAGAAGLLASDSLDPLSRDELDGRVALLEAEIARVRAHQTRSTAHRAAADAMFRRTEA